MAGTYSYSQLEGLWISAGGSARMAPVMAAIGMAESGGRPDAYNSSGASGLWQILGAVRPADQGRLFNPQTNAREAVLKYQEQGLDAWVTYTSGAYKKFLQSNVKATGVLTGAQDFIHELRQFVGTPYVWGGDKPGGFDCSGLIYYAAQKLGLKGVPRTSEEQWAYARHVDRAQLAPGDLVFLNFPGEASPGHVMVWIGGNQVIQAPAPGQDVQVTHFDPSSTPQAWGAKLVGFGRIPGLSGVSGGAGGGGGATEEQAALTSVTDPPPWAAAVPGAGALWEVFSNVGSLTGVMQPLADIANTIKRTEEGIAWFFVPSHWVRIFCGVIGSALVVGGLIIMGRTGRPASVSMAGSVPVVMPGGEIAPALAIGQITVGAILLFVAFHNLPSGVSDFGGFMSFLQGELQNEGRATS